MSEKRMNPAVLMGLGILGGVALLSKQGKLGEGSSPNDAPREKPILTCSFCGMTSKEARVVIAGPSVNICNECVDLCKEIIDEDPYARRLNELRGFYYSTSGASISREAGW